MHQATLIYDMAADGSHTLTTIRKAAALLACTGMLLTPLASFASMSHARAKRLQEAQDRRHHHKAKIVGISAGSGALIGGLAGGPVGTVVGAGVGAGGGFVANKIRKHHSIQKRMHRGY